MVPKDGAFQTWIAVWISQWYRILYILCYIFNGLIQGKLIPGYHNFDPQRGTITIPANELKSLLQKNAGTGQRIVGDIPFSAGYKERIDFGTVIGEYAKKEKGVIVRQQQTCKGIVIYSKKGVYVVPSDPGAKLL